jgi:hypothetical protein
MAVYKQSGSKNWWYKFNWNGEKIRESTKQTNKRVAEQMEAAHKVALAKGEVGIRERKAVPTLSPLAKSKLDAIPANAITDFIETLRSDRLQISSINRVLEVLRRMLRLSLEWGKTEKVPPKIQMLPGENERDRVLTDDEENRYLTAAAKVGPILNRLIATL